MSLEKLTRARAREAPLVSVLIAAYRRPDTVAKTIRSAFADRAIPVEVIVVVDGCPETALAARTLAAEPDLVLVESAVNLGIARSRNRALELARGELCVHLDADDALAPGAIAAIVAAFQGKPHVGAVYGDLEVVGRSEGEVATHRREPDFPGRRAFLEAPFDVPLLAYRRLVGRAAGGLDEGAMRCDNASLMARIARTHAVRHLPRVLLRHRVDGQNHSLTYRPADCASCASVTSCRLAEARRTSASRESHRLKKLSLVLTTRCNLDCSYCYTRRYKWDLTTEDCLRLLVQARDQGATTVAFTGGEPSLHEGFDTVIASAADLGLEVLVISNGWNWPDERIALFTSLPRARLALSLEGRTAAKHDAIRGPGSHATLMKFLERVRAKAPGFPISAIVVSTEDGTGELEDIARWAMDDLELEALRVDRVAPSGNAEANEEFSPGATRRYLEAARAIAARYPGRVESLTDSFPAEGCPLYVNFVDDTFPDLQVFADGTVPMCVFLHLDRPTRLGMASLDVEELLTRRNCARAKALIDEPFKDRARQIERKGLFTCVECLEGRNALDRQKRWPPAGRALPVVASAPARELVGRPRSAAERSGLAPRLVVLG